MAQKIPEGNVYGMVRRRDSEDAAGVQVQEGQSAVGVQVQEESQKMQQKKWKICTFWHEGNCRRGNQCTFAHGPQEIGEEVDPGFKNKKSWLCWHWDSEKGPGSCWWGNGCPFAHGEGQLGKSEKPVATNQQWKGKGPVEKEAESHGVKEAGSPERSSCAAQRGRSRHRGRSCQRGKSSLERSRHRGRSCKDSRSKERSCQPEVVSAAVKKAESHAAGREQEESSGERERHRKRHRDSPQEAGRERHRRRHRDSPQVLLIIIQTDSLFPLHSNLSAK